MKCTICNHPDRPAIDRALLSGAILASLSHLYGLSKSALHRHKTHLQAKIRLAQERLRESLDLGLFLKLSIYLELSQNNARTAGAEGNIRASNQAIRECTRIVAMMTKMDLPLDPELVHCLMFSPQWLSEDGLLPGAFQALAEARQAMSQGLLAPCPEPEPPPPDLAAHDDADDWDEPEAGITSPSPLETQNSNLDTLAQQWEKSGKLPGKTSPVTPNNEQYQSDIQAEKITGKCLAVGRESEAHPDVNPSTADSEVSSPDVGRESTRRAAGAQAPPAVDLSSGLHRMDKTAFHPEPETSNQPLKSQGLELETFFHNLGDKLKKSGKVIWPRPPLKKSGQDSRKQTTGPSTPVHCLPDPMPVAAAHDGR